MSSNSGGTGVARRRLVQLLLSHRLPEDSVATLLDRNGAIIARTRDSARRLGDRLAPELAAQAASADEGIGAGRTKEGLDLVHLYTRSRETGWTVSLGVSQKVIGAPMERAVAGVAAGAALALLVGLAGAIGLGRRIARPISRLAESAGALAGGEREDLRKRVYEG